MRRRLLAMLPMAFWLAAAFAETTPWHLMSRHGECTDVNGAVRHRFRDMPPIAGPTEFADEMKRRGHAAKVTNGYGGNRNAVLVEVPEREVSLLFVKKELCREFTSPR